MGQAAAAPQRHSRSGPLTAVAIVVGGALFIGLVVALAGRSDDSAIVNLERRVATLERNMDALRDANISANSAWRKLRDRVDQIEAANAPAASVSEAPRPEQAAGVAPARDARPSPGHEPLQANDDIALAADTRNTEPAPTPQPSTGGGDPTAPDSAPDAHDTAAQLEAILDRVSTRQADMTYLAGNRRGFIQNAQGDKCTYTQVPTRDDSVSHFYRTLTGTDSVLTFDDQGCMTGTGVYKDINLRMINNVLSNWYEGSYLTHPDEMYDTSRMQINGYCVQSRTRQNRAFLVDYFTADDSILVVVHNIALQGCG